MLTYSLADTGEDSLYEYLYKCIKDDIVSQKLRPGEKLPSKRAFAKNLGISVITVENAYAQLIAEGYIYSEPKRGFFVSSLIPGGFIYAGTKSQAAPSVNVVNTENASGGSHPEIIDFVSNQTSISNFPFSVWSKLIRDLLNENQQELVTIPPSGGVLRLRSAIAEYLREFRDISVAPEQIIVGAGTEYLYGLLIQLLGFDKIYGVEDPGYKKITQIYKRHEVKCVHIPMDASGISMEQLEDSGAEVLHLSPSHHFPSGIVTPISRRYELLRWAAASEDRYIIEDDYDIEFRMSGKPVPSMLSIDRAEKIIYMNTFSKTLASTVRISYMVLPMHLVKKYYEQLAFYSCTVSNFEQYLLARFMIDGYFEKHINRMRRYYHQKRDLLISKIKESELSRYASIYEADSGLHFILGVKTEKSDADFCAEALQKGLKITALSGYYTDPARASAHGFVVNYTAVPEEKMDEAIRILLELVR